MSADKVIYDSGRLDVAVLLAAFNGAQWIDVQIKSIIEQENVNVKIFISVDPSTDKTMALCQDWASRNSSIFVFSSVEHFGGAARNFFKIFSEVNIQEFDYVCFADQDDIWLPNKLMRAHEMLSRTGADAY